METKNIIIIMAIILILSVFLRNNLSGAETLQNIDKTTPVTINEDVKMDEVKETPTLNPKVKFETSLGDFEIELYQEKAPITVENFLSYVDEGYYDNLIFHRVIDGFMVQGGGFDETLNQKATKDPIKNEADNGLKNEIYTVAMARTNVVDSATSQFFINVNNNEFLNYRGPSASDYGYAVFGKVTSGTQTIDKIKAVPTTVVQGMSDVPTDTVLIKKATRI